jgi:NAD(P)H-hydrate epimerase
LQQKLAAADALLIGPGLDQQPPTRIFLSDLFDQTDSFPPLVLDADALNILAQHEKWWTLIPPNTILTPHPGEMARLTNTNTNDVQNLRLEMVAEMAVKWQQIVLLKGAHTVIASPDGRAVVLPFANPALAKAGSGDVLAGAIVGLLAQGISPFEATVVGAYLHGLAGELARESIGVTSVVAGDLVEYLAMAIKEVRGV